jgi:hypothetical protein
MTLNARPTFLASTHKTSCSIADGSMPRLAFRNHSRGPLAGGGSVARRGRHGSIVGRVRRNIELPSSKTGVGVASRSVLRKAKRGHRRMTPQDAVASQ